ncbi:glycosyltransferase family 39 protein [Pseudomonas sp. Z18(2022)]|uniref:glycosyltransferase family 39 protein n=1 Tax=Pseudomonas sp. Z18(2022) TaxID=2983410 RepID=UPI002E80B2CB|nr:glycosyltransferase family 39 protein [Pseudomonas sp. Z18(2022)]
MSSVASERARVLACGLILIVGGWARFHHIDTAGGWSDEAFSILLSVKSPTEIMFHTTRDVHPPLYYWLLHGWMQVMGDSVLAARALSALFGMVTVVLGMWLMSRISRWPTVIVGGFLLALSPFAVRYSQEVRMYALHGALMLGATIALVYWLENPGNRRPLFLYCLLMVAGFYTHYFTGVCVISHWLYLLWLSKARSGGQNVLRLPAWWGANVAIVVMFIPWVPHLWHQIKYSGFNWIQQPSIKDVVSVFWQFLNFSDGLAMPVWAFYGVPVVLLMVSVMIVVRDDSARRWHALLVIYAWAPPVVVVLVSCFYPLFVPHYFLFCSLAFPMTVAVAASQLWARSKIVGFGLLTGVTILQAGGLGIIYAKQPQDVFEFSQFDRVAGYISVSFRAGDSVLVLDSFMYLPMLYYLKNETVPLYYTPLNSDGTSARPDGYQTWTLVNDKAEQVYVDGVASLAPVSGRVWLVGDVEADTLHFKLPDSWRLLQGFSAGIARVQLFAICPRNDSVDEQALKNRGCEE